MKRILLRERARIVALAFCGLALASCAAPVSTGAFRNGATLDTQLRRGVSTKQDVQALLGIPTGPGSWLLTDLDPTPREIWYYEDIAMGGSTFRMQTIFVFFKGNVYDGYLWSSGTGAADVKF